MAGRVDTRALVVRNGATGIPFAVDCGTGAAILDPDGEPHRLRVLGWSEKCSLARFAGAGAAFVEQQFVAICGGGVLPQDPPRRAAATALAMWLHGSPALPLDPALLGEVTIRLCAALGVGPAELAALPAPEVESLWHAIEAEATDAGAVDGHGLPAVDGVTRILIEPDPPAPAERPLQAEPPPNPEAAIPISADSGPLDRVGAAAEPEGSIPAPAAPRSAEPASALNRAETASAHPRLIPTPSARQPAGSRQPTRATPHPRRTGAGTTAAGAGQGVEAAAESTEATFGSGPPPSPTTAALARNSGRSATKPAIPSAPDRSSDAGAASGALRSPPGSPAQPARFRLLSAQAADVPGPRTSHGRSRSDRASSRRAGHGTSPASGTAGIVPSVHASPERLVPGTPHPGRGRPADFAEVHEPTVPEDVSPHPPNPGVRSLAGSTITGSNLVPSPTPKGPTTRSQPADRRRSPAASRPKVPMPRFAAPDFKSPSCPAPQTEAAMAVDSRLRALVDIVSRSPETPSDLDRNPEALIETFSERLAEAASELGLAGGD